jgi:selenocysteine lyase/cysteine desulfurase
VAHEWIRRIAIPTSRRTFIAGLGAVSASSLAHAAIQGATPTASGGEATARGIEPDLAYLNTGSPGACAPAVLDRVIEAWRMLERNPVANAYGEGAVGAIADATRAQAAALLGCAAGELLLTTGTTSGMNAVAGSVRLATGEAVLTTDQEHRGATSGWHYRARRDRVRIDQVPVPPGEANADAIVARFAAAIRPERPALSARAGDRCPGR